MFWKKTPPPPLTGSFVAININEVAGLRISPSLKKCLPETISSEEECTAIIKTISKNYDFEISPGSRAFNAMHADYTAVRLAYLFGVEGFNFSVDYLLSLHKFVFSDMFDDAGSFRTGAIDRKLSAKPDIHEWLIKPEDIPIAVKQLFAQKQNFFNNEKIGVDIPYSAKVLASFSTELWQIHPFPIGNTRMLVLFLIKYLQHVGHEESIRPFWEHAVNFRQSLIMANSEAKTTGVEAITRPLELMFEMIISNSSQ